MIVDKKLVSWDEFKNIISQGQNEDYSIQIYRGQSHCSRQDYAASN